MSIALIFTGLACRSCAGRCTRRPDELLNGSTICRPTFHWTDVGSGRCRTRTRSCAAAPPSSGRRRRDSAAGRTAPSRSARTAGCSRCCRCCGLAVDRKNSPLRRARRTAACRSRPRRRPTAARSPSAGIREAVLCAMPLPGGEDAVGRCSRCSGTSVPIDDAGLCGADELPRDRVHRLAVRGRARIHAVVRSRATYSRGALEAFHWSGKKFDACQIPVVVRDLVHEADAVVERQAVRVIFQLSWTNPSWLIAV